MTQKKDEAARRLTGSQGDLNIRIAVPEGRRNHE